MPIAFALAGAIAYEHDTGPGMLRDAGVARVGELLMADKGYRSADFEPSQRGGDNPHPPGNQIGESPGGSEVPHTVPPDYEAIYHIIKEQLGLDRHRGRTPGGAITRGLHRTLVSPRSSGTTKPPTGPAQPAP